MRVKIKDKTLEDMVLRTAMGTNNDTSDVVEFILYSGIRAIQKGDITINDFYANRKRIRKSESGEEVRGDSEEVPGAEMPVEGEGIRD